jgi:uncharacterized membrane protein
MNSLLIASFRNESSARSAMKKLDDLALDGQIELYERTLIRKTMDGRCELYKDSGSAGWQTISGAVVGSLVGLLGGPIGAVIGLMSGGVVGSVITDHEQHDFGQEVMRNVEDNIPPGMVAIVAHVGESEPELVDSVFNRFEARIVRRDIRKIRNRHARKVASEIFGSIKE